ncbi:MAG: hypothetical protein HY903_01465 [Deltaproteobacteria bacterium]|nr:hypothetical protein [Deltaproteobacteria bacterium]
MARLWTNLMMLASLAVLLAVGWYFGREYLAADLRQRELVSLKRIADDEGPCAALERVRALSVDGDVDLQRALSTRRQVFAALVVGEGDRRGQSALLSADAEGLVDRGLCEQMKLTRELGEVHPLLELLRYTREGGDPCDDPQGLDQVLRSLSSHRPQMLHALMEQVARLRCLPPWLSTRLAEDVLGTLKDAPDAMDDLEVLRVAKFLNAWAPVHAAQFACLMESDHRPSLLAGSIGCTPYLLRQVLPRYRYLVGIVASDKGPEVAAGSEVLLLATEGERCQIRPEADPPRVLMVSCRDLVPISDVEVAVLVESVAYGLARASLIAGMVHYDPTSGKLQPSRQEPESRSWYGYSRDGEALGLAQTVRFSDLASQLGEDVPETPLRTFCRQAGARYCYDVDWAQVVDQLEGEPVLFLSRPAPSFLAEGTVPPKVSAAWIGEAYGKRDETGVTPRVYALPRGGALLVAVQPGGVDLRWRPRAGDPWRAQAFGVLENGATPPSARLLAVMDLQGNGRPEVLLQRIRRVARDGEIKDAQDELLLLGVDPAAKKVETINALTVHEY